LTLFVNKRLARAARVETTDDVTPKTSHIVVFTGKDAPPLSRVMMKEWNKRRANGELSFHVVKEGWLREFAVSREDRVGDSPDSFELFRESDVSSDSVSEIMQNAVVFFGRGLGEETKDSLVKLLVAMGGQAR
jgi:hypothetical protein